MAALDGVGLHAPEKATFFLGSALATYCLSEWVSPELGESGYDLANRDWITGHLECGVVDGILELSCYRLKLKNDRFVLLRRARDLDEKAKETLERWSGEFPELGAAWVAKESFFDIWDCSTAKEAHECDGIWLANLDPAVAPAFFDLTPKGEKTLGNWLTYARANNLPGVCEWSDPLMTRQAKRL
jgi:hypothetical protein